MSRGTRLVACLAGVALAGREAHLEGRETGIEGEAGDLHAVAAQHLEVVLGVVADLRDGRVGQDRGQPAGDQFQGELRHLPVAVGDRDVPAGSGLAK